jgi:hypothetical protein
MHFSPGGGRHPCHARSCPWISPESPGPWISSESQVKEKRVDILIRLRNQIWDKYHFSGTQLWQRERRAKGREFIMPPRRTGFNEYMPQGQRTLTEVDGVAEIGPVGPATQKEVAPAQANTSRKRDAAEAAAQTAAARRAARGHATAAQGRCDRQPAATVAQQGGSSGKLGQVANINTTTPNKPVAVPPSVINLVSPDLVLITIHLC